MSFPRKREPSQRNSVMQAGGRYAVYIMASRRNGTLYVGVTNNLAARAHQHRTGDGGEFTRKYGVTQLVWYEFHSDIKEAIASEKRIKKWERRWKLELIESFNPEWADLYETLNG
jgi:putative endonuclease